MDKVKLHEHMEYPEIEYLGRYAPIPRPFTWYILTGEDGVEVSRRKVYGTIL